MSEHASAVDFFRFHGLTVDQPHNDGRWHRVPTVDHPKKKNGAYLLDGDRAVCQNWATMPEALTWRGADDKPKTPAQLEAERVRRRQAMATQEQGWKKAAARAERMLHAARPGNHGYLYRKGFEHAHGLVLPDGELMVPMRSLSGAMVGAQVIRWLQEPLEWEKKFLPGMRAQGASFVMGPSMARECILCEGYATALSLDAAARELKLRCAIVACFSAHNIVVMANAIAANDGARLLVFADNDPHEPDPEKAKRNPGEAGQRAALASGLPWTMSPIVGQDANDTHQMQGLRELAGLLMDLRRETTNTWEPYWK